MKNYKQIHVAKSEKAYSEVKTRGVTEQSFDRDHGQQSRTEAAISADARNRDGLMQVKQCHLVLKGTEKARQNEGSLAELI